jgi:hypothetical protein
VLGKLLLDVCELTSQGVTKQPPLATAGQLRGKVNSAVGLLERKLLKPAEAAAELALLAIKGLWSSAGA